MAKIDINKRLKIFARDNYTCRYCGKKLQKDDLSIDHVMPTCKGGNNSYENLVTACHRCNIEKHVKTLEEWGKQLLPIPKMDGELNG